MSRFSPADLPDLTGRTAVVTGANSGIGLVTARVLAERGAQVDLPVRDLEKGKAAATMTGPVEVRTLDFPDRSFVRAFAHDLPGPVDLLVNNAGLSLGPPERVTARRRGGTAARRLWEVSEGLTGTRFTPDVPAPPAS